ncbi:hypothetical protein WMY93_016561 [Mugilogobius chulae]|uniref:Fucosyltransferase n=1 Tax=Mugilogobius chulae TaxID=88201 RepID=A0AAW0NS87_9GOBI
MSSAPFHRILRPLLIGTFVLGCFVTLFLMYFKPATSWLSGPVDSTVSTERVKSLLSTRSEKNVTTVLVWLWPFGQTYDLAVCSSLFNIEGCLITADRNLYNKSDGVVIHHRDICTDLSNLPPLQRPSFQKWIWMNLESPSHSSQLPGIENLFNLTLNYRQDADIQVPYGSIVAAEGEEDFVPPSKNKLICWIVSNWNQDHVRVKYYNELYKHIELQVLPGLENSIHKDYITEKLYNPLSVGTVPVVLGPPRQNYENFIQGDAFIHVDDFGSPKELADYLLLLDKNEECTSATSTGGATLKSRSRISGLSTHAWHVTTCGGTRSTRLSTTWTSGTGVGRTSGQVVLGVGPLERGIVLRVLEEIEPRKAGWRWGR